MQHKASFSRNHLKQGNCVLQNLLGDSKDRRAEVARQEEAADQQAPGVEPGE